MIIIDFFFFKTIFLLQSKRKADEIHRMALACCSPEPVARRLFPTTEFSASNNNTDHSENHSELSSLFLFT